MTFDYDKMFAFVIWQIDELYRDFKGNNTYKFPRTDKNINLVHSFLKRITNTKHKTTIISEGYIKRVLKFSFGHYANKPVYIHGRKIILLNHVLSGKIFEQYKRKTNEHIHFTQVNRGKKIKKVRRKKVFKPTTQQQKVRYDMIVNPQVYEEQEKKRYHNKTKGYFWCLTMTTMYNHKSKHCSGCKFSKICKKRLKENQSKIYTIRGYDQKETQGKNI